MKMDIDCKLCSHTCHNLETIDFSTLVSTHKSSSTSLIISIKNLHKLREGKRERKCLEKLPKLEKS